MSDPTTEPTAEGRRRYPFTDGYYPDIFSGTLSPDHGLPCTCTRACHDRCGGQCGCPACTLAFTIYCDEAGLLGGDVPVTLAERLEEYRSVG